LAPLAVDRQIANLVADKELRLGQQLEPLVEFAFGQDLAECGNQSRRGNEQGAHPHLVTPTTIGARRTSACGEVRKDGEEKRGNPTRIGCVLG